MAVDNRLKYREVSSIACNEVIETLGNTPAVRRGFPIKLFDIQPTELVTRTTRKSKKIFLQFLQFITTAPLEVSGD